MTDSVLVVDGQSQSGYAVQIEQTVDALNKKFFVVEEYGGKCIVAWQEPDPLMNNRLKFEIQTFREFHQPLHPPQDSGQREPAG